VNLEANEELEGRLRQHYIDHSSQLRLPTMQFNDVIGASAAPMSQLRPAAPRRYAPWLAAAAIIASTLGFVALRSSGGRTLSPVAPPSTTVQIWDTAVLFDQIEEALNALDGTNAQRAALMHRILHDCMAKHGVDYPIPPIEKIEQPSGYQAFWHRRPDINIAQSFGFGYWPQLASPAALYVSPAPADLGPKLTDEYAQALQQCGAGPYGPESSGRTTEAQAIWASQPANTLQDLLSTVEINSPEFASIHERYTQCMQQQGYAAATNPYDLAEEVVYGAGEQARVRGEDVDAARREADIKIASADAECRLPEADAVAAIIGPAAIDWLANNQSTLTAARAFWAQTKPPGPANEAFGSSACGFSTDFTFDASVFTDSGIDVTLVEARVKFGLSADLDVVKQAIAESVARTSGNDPIGAPVTDAELIAIAHSQTLNEQMNPLREFLTNHSTTASAAEFNGDLDNPAYLVRVTEDFTDADRKALQQLVPTGADVRVTVAEFSTSELRTLSEEVSLVMSGETGSVPLAKVFSNLQMVPLSYTISDEMQCLRLWVANIGPSRDDQELGHLINAQISTMGHLPPLMIEQGIIDDPCVTGPTSSAIPPITGGTPGSLQFTLDISAANNPTFPFVVSASFLNPRQEAVPDNGMWGVQHWTGSCWQTIAIMPNTGSTASPSMPCASSSMCEVAPVERLVEPGSRSLEYAIKLWPVASGYYRVAPRGDEDAVADYVRVP
jgi:hypothetical protein